jgi:Ca2+-dependent lipid-binding protein
VAYLALEPVAAPMLQLRQLPAAARQARTDWTGVSLTLVLLSATGLKAADRRGRSDPYAKLELGSHPRKSRWVAQTCDPEWNQTLGVIELDRGTLAASPLRIAIFDHDDCSKDDLLGEVPSEKLPHPSASLCCCCCCCCCC